MDSFAFVGIEVLLACNIVGLTYYSKKNASNDNGPAQFACNAAIIMTLVFMLGVLIAYSHTQPV